jgi:hypothetical protein
VEIGEDGQPVAQLYRMDIHLFTPELKETSGSKILLMVWEFRDIM